MRKRMTAVILLVLITLLACIPSVAPAATKVKIKKDVTYKEGRTTISWKVSGDEATGYMVWGKAAGGDSEQSMFLIGSTTAHKIKAVQLIPGKKYDITITDALFRPLDSKTIKVPKAETFKDGRLKASSVKVTVEPVQQKNAAADPSRVKSLKAKDIKKALKNGNSNYGVKYTMKMPQLAKARSFFVTLAFESPDGFLWTVLADDIEFKRVNGGYQVLWFPIVGQRFFSELYDTTKDIPTGKYKIYLYWDGMLVDKSTFNVS